MAWFFAVTLFTSALLLFFVQPMVGKMVLPLMGGSPSVWNTCMVFFQALLLGGYAYAHVTTKRLGPRRQASVHLVVLVLPLLALAVVALWKGSPVAVFPALAPQGSDYPFFGVVVLLAATIGVPFFVVATSAPLLQKWFADTDHPDAKDPYFLYGASNLGSLLALVLYPLLVEPSLRLSHQGWLWGAGYVLLAVLTYGCAQRLWTAPPKLPGLAPDATEPLAALAAPTAWTRLRWVLLAFVPSSLMLSVTTYITTDVSPIPLFWVAPLALYLLTFIIAFGRTPAWVLKANALVAPIMILLIIYLDSGVLKLPYAFNLAVHLLTFTLVALMCHGELARSRPPARLLTEFYLWMSFGGVLGGLFNALLAPLVFKGLTEYPLVLVLGALLLPRDDVSEDSGFKRLLDFVMPGVVFGLAYGLLWAFNRSYGDSTLNPNHILDWVSDKVFALTKTVWEERKLTPSALKMMLSLGIPALVCYVGVERPLRFGLGVLAIWLAGVVHTNEDYVLYRERSFFGRVNVEVERDYDDEGDVRVTYHRLTHGTTLHGKQQYEPLSTEPLTYYHRTGPLGAVFRGFPGKSNSTAIAAIGLGTGSVAAYGEPGRTLTFYEIDPAVRRIAENRDYFTYVPDCKADQLSFKMGDARLMMAKEAAPGQYAVIVVDAFSSDAIPMHLLTLEAVRMYLDKLAERGIICLHISNRYLDLEPVAGRIAKELGLVGLTQSDNDTYVPSGEDKIPGKQTSVWVMLARTMDDLDRLTNQPAQVEYEGRTVTLTKWEPVKVQIPPLVWSKRTDKTDSPLWTDDFSNMLQAVTAFQKKEKAEE